MARKRRQFRGTWFPVLGQENSDPDPTTWTTVNEALLSASAGQVTVGVFPVLRDYPQEHDNTASSAALGLYTLNEYALRRVVGKIVCNIEDTVTTATATTPFTYSVAAGLFIARAGDDADNPGYAADTPIGGTAAWQTDYNPLEPDCIREPWLWRRTWQLGSPLAALRQINAQAGGAPTITSTRGLGIPWSNTGYGSVADGPHVDAKTRRRVGNDDRLWLALAYHYNPFSNISVTEIADCHFYWEFRAFGAMRRARNRGAF